jgi:hypothetical protein
VCFCCDADWEAVVKLSDDFNGADLRNVCTEAGNMFTIAYMMCMDNVIITAAWTLDQLHWSVANLDVTSSLKLPTYLSVLSYVTDVAVGEWTEIILKE